MTIYKLNPLYVLVSSIALSACTSSHAPLQPAENETNSSITVPNKKNVANIGNISSAVTPESNVEYLKTGTRSQTETATNPAITQIEKSPEEGKITLNLQNAEIKGVVDAVMGDILKLNYIVKPEIQGRITFRTGKPVTKEALLPALETVLRSLSIVIIMENGVYQVAQKDGAERLVKSTGMVTPSSALRPGYAIEIFPLKYVDVAEMQKILESFVLKETIIQPNEQYRMLIVTGTSQERAAVKQAVESFDKDWLDGKSIALYHLEQLDAEQMVADIKQVFQAPMNFLGGRVRLVPIPRIKTIMGVADEKKDLEEAEGWIRRLDKSKVTGKRLFVYNVQHGTAKDLVSALRQVLEGIVETKGAISRPPDNGNPQSNVKNEPHQEASSLVAMDENNSILFYGEEERFTVIQDALKVIDVFPRQVMIDAVLAEVVLNDNLRYGVQWGYDSGKNKVTFSATDNGSLSSQFPGFSYVYSGISNAQIVLNALAEKTDVKVISAPKLSVLNNQKASLQVGDQVPIITQTSQATGTPGAPVVNSVQMRDTGVILEVTPRISDNGNVTLLITQEVSDVTPTKSSGIDSPTIQRRKIQTVVSTKDGNTVALGGLIRENNTQGNSGIPLLKDIPLLGNAFRSNTSGTRKSELIMLLVPHVMRNQEETQSVLDALIEGANSAAKAAHATKKN